MSETQYLLASNEDGLLRIWKWDSETLEFSKAKDPIIFNCKFRTTDSLLCLDSNYTGTQFAVAGDAGMVHVLTTVKPGASEAQKDTDSLRIEGSSAELESNQTAEEKKRRRAINALFPSQNDLAQDVSVMVIVHLEGYMGSVTDVIYSHNGKRILSG